MTSGSVTTPSGETIEIDMSNMEERLKGQMKEYLKELKEYKPKAPEGKGVVETFSGGNKTQLLEQLQNAESRPITEQWTVAIPNLTSAELAAHLRDYVWVTDVVKGKPGEIVNIPYVDDFDFTSPNVVPGATTLAEVTGLVNVLTTVLKEGGKYFDCKYGDIEKIDANLLDEINRTFAHAAVRFEDKIIIETLATQTTSDYAASMGGGTGTNAFYVRYIPEALGKLLHAGKEIHPGDCVLYITARPYAALLKELAADQAVAYARGDIMQKGVVENFLGVRVLVGGEVESTNRGATTASATGTYEVAFLMRAKRCMALAPKRDILIETDRQIAQRKLRIAGSHTFGVQILDATEAVRIITGQAA